MFSSRYFQLSVLHWSAHGCWASSSHCLQGVEEHGAASRGEANLQGMLLSPRSSPAEHRQTDTPWASPYCLSSNPHWVFLFFLIKFTYSLCFLRHVSWSHSLPIPSHPPSTSAPLPPWNKTKFKRKKEKKIRKKGFKRGNKFKILSWEAAVQRNVTPQSPRPTRLYLQLFFAEFGSTTCLMLCPR